jgi:hypothetical protein
VRNQGRVTLGIVAALATVGAITAALTLGGSDPAAEPVDPVAAARGTKVAAPPTLDGQPKIKDAELQAVVDQMRSTVLSVVPGSLSSEVGFYGDMTEQKLLAIVALTAPIADPTALLSNALTSLGDSGVVVAQPEPVDPGPLGGQATCGNATASGVELAVCGWADNGSLGLVMFHFTQLDEAKDRFLRIRAEVESR